MTNNVVLYRKYRPQGFAEIIGQQHVVQTLTNSILAKSISHAYLFAGPRGSGKTTLARVFAKAINCENPNGAEPCHKCVPCQEILQNRSIDLIEIDAASHRGVDDIRELREGARFAPVRSKYKVYIIDECHQLSKDAANALLKTLEEPPSHAVFLMATTELHKMIPTIVSRCQKFDLKRLLLPEITQKLARILDREKIKYDNSALSLIALNSRGSFRDAESLLDECINFTGAGKSITAENIKQLLGFVEISQISKFVDSLLQKNAKDSFGYLAALSDAGVDLQEFAKTLIFYLRQMLLLKIDPGFLSPQTSGLSDQELAKLKTQSEGLGQGDIKTMIETFLDAENKMKYSHIPQLCLELAASKITFS